MAANELRYFRPVASLPGFARSLGRTIADLRAARVDSDALARTGEPGMDLAKLLSRYETELGERRLVDLAAIFEMAAQAAKTEHRWLGLPVALLDVALRTV